MSSYKLPTGDSTDPVSLPPHHSTPPLVETPAITKIHMLIRVTGYILSKSAKPVKSLNDVLKHQKPKAHPTEHAATSPPPPHQVTSTSQSSPSHQNSMARPANLDDGESMAHCLPGRKFTDYHIQVSAVVQVSGAIQVGCRNAKSLHSSNRGPS